MQSPVENRRLSVSPRHADVPPLIAGLQSFEIKIDLKGNDTYWAFKVGNHDALVVCQVSVAG